MLYRKLSWALFCVALVIVPQVWGADRPTTSQTWRRGTRLNASPTVTRSCWLMEPACACTGSMPPSVSSPLGLRPLLRWITWWVAVFIWWRSTSTVTGGWWGSCTAKEGYDINASMVCAGFAWWYERYAKDSELLRDCESEARGAGKGLWRDPEPVRRGGGR